MLDALGTEVVEAWVAIGRKFDLQSHSLGLV